MASLLGSRLILNSPAMKARDTAEPAKRNVCFTKLVLPSRNKNGDDCGSLG
jgi:hypothetical protein